MNVYKIGISSKEKIFFQDRLLNNFPNMLWYRNVKNRDSRHIPAWLILDSIKQEHFHLYIISKK